MLTGCAEKKDEATEYYNVSVSFLKVGKADAAIIKTENHTVVIDCGEKSDGDKVCDKLNEYDSGKIDYLILTHFDQDHIGGAAKVLKNFSVEHIISPDYSEESKEYDKLLKAMDNNDLKFENPENVTTLSLDDAEFKIYACKKTDYSNGDDNNHSLVIKMTHHDKVFLFTGDALEERLEEIMDIGDCDVLKEPYHGRRIDNLGEFLDKTTPEYAIISTDKDTLSSYTEKEFTDRNIKTYITFRDGNIYCTSDGKEISFELSDKQ